MSEVFNKQVEWAKRAIPAGQVNKLTRVVAFNAAMEMVERAYEQGKKDALRDGASATDVCPD